MTLQYGSRNEMLGGELASMNVLTTLFQSAQGRNTKQEKPGNTGGVENHNFITFGRYTLDVYHCISNNNRPRRVGLKPATF